MLCSNSPTMTKTKALARTQGVARLAWKTDLSKSQVQSYLRALEPLAEAVASRCDQPALTRRS
jgi:hypothetical protein